VPDGWEVLEETVTTYRRGARTAVEFERSIDPGGSDTLEYVVKTPDDGVTTGTFGPIEVSVDGRTWVEVSGTIEEITAGPSI
jgi:hypothetical protein